MSEPIAAQPALQDATVHSVLLWRADSITLARLREPLAEIRVLAMIPCESTTTTIECGTCWPCRMRKLWAKFETAVRAPT